jgi:hypothetical protein
MSLKNSGLLGLFVNRNSIMFIALIGSSKK